MDVEFAYEVIYSNRVDTIKLFFPIPFLLFPTPHLKCPLLPPIFHLQYLKNHIEDFAVEITTTHIAYVNNLTAARKRSTQLIEEIIETGFRPDYRSMPPFLSAAQPKGWSYEDACKCFKWVNITYKSDLCGGVLEWTLF